MSESRDRFLELMKKEILKLDLAELDFGIYRILNYRRAEIEAFFDDELPALLDAAIGREGESRRAELTARLDQLRSSLDDAAVGFGYDSAFVGEDLRPELQKSPRAREYSEVETALAALEEGEVFAGSEEDRLYNALYTFFSRYYRDGDFQPQQRRARDARYSVPYNGEDVHFHWRSKGSHYMKTTEELRSYSFRSGEWRVRFELVEAFQEPDNVKGNSRYFFPVPEECRTEGEDDERLFVIPFAFRRLTAAEEKTYQKMRKGLEGDNVQDRIINDLGPNIDAPDGVSKEEVTYHLRRYSRKNRTDYFVHPQLGEFLRGELDYYLKNEFLDIEGLTTTEAMADRLLKMRVLREVARRVIDLLDEIESFQAKLFRKRKFALCSSYLVPVRLVPEELWDEVIASGVQIDRWRNDFAFKARVTRRTLETHPSLVVDSSLFDENFQVRLLSSFDDIHGVTDGVLIKGENFGALRTIQGQYRHVIDTIYIDPPYNTGTDGFLFKDSFAQRSTWASLMADRLRLARTLMGNECPLFINVDDNELGNLLQLVRMEFPTVEVLIWKKAHERYGKMKNTSSIRIDHDYVVIGYSGDAILSKVPDYPRFSQKPKQDRRGEFYVGYIARGEEGSNPDHKNYYEVRSPTGKRFRAQFAVDIQEFDRLDADDRIYWTDEGVPYQKIYLHEPRFIRQSSLVALDDATTYDAKKEFLNYFPGTDELVNALNPKPVRLLRNLIAAGGQRDGIVMDFFAGSGTTGDAVVGLNRTMGYEQKVVLIDVGEYFDDVLVRRIAKVMYAPEWKDGAPKEEPKFAGIPPDWVTRSPRLVQVVRLESYEDSLNSLIVDEEEGHSGSKLRIRYVISDSVDDAPWFLATEKLEEPFDYQLEVHSEEGVRLVDVDLVTTFNLMKGILPKRYRELDHDGRRYVVIEGSDGGESVLVVWRSVLDLDPAGERAFLEEQIPKVLGTALASYVRIWHNADSVLPNGVSLDAEFKRLMFEPEPALM